MSLLAVGLSHNTAAVGLLERAALSTEASIKLLADLTSGEHVAEAMVVATCNRVEVYAEVDRFHGGVQEVSEGLANACGVALEELTGHLYVHYEDAGVQHLFSVAAGLDSMVVGEQQILGQLRSALAQARAEGTVGRPLGSVVERALHVGKRAHSETGIDLAGRSLVTVGIEIAAAKLGSRERAAAAVVGAGAISSLTAASLAAAGVDQIAIVGRTAASRERVASLVGGRAAPMSDLVQELAVADLVVSCTGAAGTIITTEDVTVALERRNGRPLVILDLALPRDVDLAVRELRGVTVVGLEDLQSVLAGEAVSVEIEAARRIVADEVAGWLALQGARKVAPTVIALRARAGEVVESELARLFGKLPELSEHQIAEVRHAMSRTVDKLLHAPTVRIKELGSAAGADTYAEALRYLFALDPQATESVARAAVVEDEQQ